MSRVRSWRNSGLTSATSAAFPLTVFRRALSMSAGARSSPRSLGLIGTASISTTTSPGAGSATSSGSIDSTSLRSRSSWCRAVGRSRSRSCPKHPLGVRAHATAPEGASAKLHLKSAPRRRWPRATTCEQLCHGALASGCWDGCPRMRWPRHDRSAADEGTSRITPGPRRGHRVRGSVWLPAVSRRALLRVPAARRDAEAEYSQQPTGLRTRMLASGELAPAAPVIARGRLCCTSASAGSDDTSGSAVASVSSAASTRAVVGAGPIEADTHRARGTVRREQIVGARVCHAVAAFNGVTFASARAAAHARLLRRARTQRRGRVATLTETVASAVAAIAVDAMAGGTPRVVRASLALPKEAAAARVARARRGAVGSRLVSG